MIRASGDNRYPPVSRQGGTLKFAPLHSPMLKNFLNSIIKDSLSITCILASITSNRYKAIMETQSAIPVTSGAHGAHGASVTHMDAHHDLHQLPQLPPWLQDPQQPTEDDPRPTPSSNALVRTVYANLFESALERIMGGTSLNTIVANDPRGIQLGRFLFWINRDETRRHRYEEACLIAAETMAHELTAIADALPPDGSSTQPLMEDVQRSALRMKARTYLMERWSPQRYGDSKRIQIDSTTLTANVTADDLSRMSLADLRALAARTFARAADRDDTIDVTPTTPTPLDEAA